jgi:hypothetical protein
MFSVPPAPAADDLSLTGIEAAFTAVTVGLCFAWPRIGSGLFGRVERQFRRLARQPRISVLAVGLSVLILRFSILPLLPIPVPFTADDYSNVLAADTFAHGRLANPTPREWVHFESMHIDMKPTYMSMYFPGQGLLLAAGKVILGNYWLAVPFAAAGMCAGLCWMLQGWLPPSWALLGGFLAVLRLGVFSYWTNTYHTAGTLAALGGAMVLGALPRFRKMPRRRYGLILGAGAVLLMFTRPYEGMILCLSVAIALLVWVRKRQVKPKSLVRAAAPGMALVALGIGWMGYYDLRVFGSPLTPPYSVNRAAYALAPYYVWQKPGIEPVYHHAEMRRFYVEDELKDYYRVHSLTGFPFMTLIKALRGILFFSGVVFLPALFMLPWALRDRRIRFLVISLVVLACGMSIEIFLFPHYLAPFAAAFYALGLQCMRHMWQWRPGDQAVGRAVLRLTVTICILMAGLRVFNKQIGCPVPGYPFSTWICNWFGPDHFVPERDRVEEALAENPGGQLAIVRYSAEHNPVDEWVYNRADIDASKVIWARDMDAASNAELIRHYGDRKVWLVQPDSPAAEVSPYPVPKQVTAALPH